MKCRYNGFTDNIENCRPISIFYNFPKYLKPLYIEISLIYFKKILSLAQYFFEVLDRQRQVDVIYTDFQKGFYQIVTAFWLLN